MGAVVVHPQRVLRQHASRLHPVVKPAAGSAILVGVLANHIEPFLPPRVLRAARTRCEVTAGAAREEEARAGEAHLVAGTPVQSGLLSSIKSFKMYRIQVIFGGVSCL